MAIFGSDTSMQVVCDGQLLMLKEGSKPAHFGADNWVQAKLVMTAFLYAWQESPSYKGGVISLPAFVLFIKANACPNCLRDFCRALDVKCEDGCTDPIECESVIAEAVLAVLPDAFALPEELEPELEAAPPPPSPDDVYRWN